MGVDWIGKKGLVVNRMPDVPMAQGDGIPVEPPGEKCKQERHGYGGTPERTRLAKGEEKGATEGGNGENEAIECDGCIEEHLGDEKKGEEGEGGSKGRGGIWIRGFSVGGVFAFPKQEEEKTERGDRKNGVEASPSRPTDDCGESGKKEGGRDAEGASSEPGKGEAGTDKGKENEKKAKKNLRNVGKQAVGPENVSEERNGGQVGIQAVEIEFEESIVKGTGHGAKGNRKGSGDERDGDTCSKGKGKKRAQGKDAVFP